MIPHSINDTHIHLTDTENNYNGINFDIVFTLPHNETTLSPQATQQVVQHAVRTLHHYLASLNTHNQPLSEQHTYNVNY